MISDNTSSTAPARYDTEEKRRKHAEYQRMWRKANPERVRLINRRSRGLELKDPVRAELRKKRIKESRKKPETLKKRQLQKKRRYQKTQYAINDHRRWSDYEIEMAFDRELTDTQISEKIGRSVQAVGLARKRYADRAPVGWVPKSGA
jgi:hypothetical protein